MDFAHYIDLLKYGAVAAIICVVAIITGVIYLAMRLTQVEDRLDELLDEIRNRP